MHLSNNKTARVLTGLAASLLLLTHKPAAAQTVSLTAGATSTTLPDGQTVPMWGYTCNAASGVLCSAANPAAAGWSPVIITVPYTASATGNSTTSLSIKLSNNLSFTAGSGTNNVPTSLVISGQLGGGLGGGGTTTASPLHNLQGTTWPVAGGADTSITLTNPGSGYTTVPTVTIHPGAGDTTGSGATAVATVDFATRTIAAITLTNAGSGYTADPIVQISAPNTSGGTQATGTLSLASVTAGPAPTGIPPAQLPRVQSFSTEVAAGGSATLTWTGLRPGTYLLESGTHPSIQVPMGLYGVVVVTPAGSAYPSTNGQPLTAAASTFDDQLALVLSEIDPVQNASVDAAVRTAGFSETKPWSGLAPNGCGYPGASGAPNPNYNTCYPATVNYSPRYYLVNGVSFDRTNVTGSTLKVLGTAAGTAASSNNLLLRLVNAGLKMHVPAVVNKTFTLVAEDGNPLPGVPRVQNEVFLPAGKTYDVLVQPVQTRGIYASATLALFDRELSLSTNNQRDGGMQTYIAVAGGAASGVGTQGGSQRALTGAASKTFFCVAGQALSVTDPLRGLLGGTTGANGVAVAGAPALPAGSTLSVQSNGTFTYTPPASGACGGSFNFTVNNNTANPLTATIAECDSATQAAGCTLTGAPTALPDSYTANNARQLTINTPGLLSNDSDPSGRPLVVDVNTVPSAATVGLTTLTVQPDGSFLATAPAAGTYTFTYNVRNTQQSAAASPATVTLTFPKGSGLQVDIVDQKHPEWKITDYRWIIEEDRTLWVDPKCQVNQDPRPTDAYGRTCPALPVEALGYNFHSAGMPMVATGCVGDVSCESGQSVLGQAAVCDSNGTCRTSGTRHDDFYPKDVVLDPNKHYFISILPGDGINPTVAGAGGPVTDSTTNKTRQFNPAVDCPAAADFAPGTGTCGHNMGGAQIPPQFDQQGNPITPAVTIALAQTPLPPAQISVYVYEDDYPLNGENDAGGGVDILAPNEPGLGSFQVVLLDQAGTFGDSTGQITYDMFNMPISNALAGTPDPLNHNMDACPLSSNKDGVIGMVITCPTYEADGKTLSPLAGQALITNLYPGLYEPQAFPAADREARGEVWLQTNTLDGGKPHEAFIRPNEPSYFQEFGPGGFHVLIGFANPQTINNRRTNSAGTGMCDSPTTGGGGLSCTQTITGHVHGTHLSRTPDERTYDSGSYDAFKFSNCYVSLGIPDQQDFAFASCDADGNFTMTGIPPGVYKMAVFDQWNDVMLDGLITSVTINGDNPKSTQDVTLTVLQWRTNLYTRTYLDTNGNGIPDRDSAGNDLEAGLPLVPINIRYRDGSKGFANTTDLNGYASYNEVFPYMNWLVVEPDQTRFKASGEHVIYDAGGPVDCSPASNAVNGNCSTSAAFLAATVESNSVPLALRVPGAVYCSDADCTDALESIGLGAYYNSSGVDASKMHDKIVGLSTGRIDPPWKSEGWQGLLGQHNFIDFGMKPFKAATATTPAENGGIQGLVVYASTRPFDDPTLDVQLTWEPAVPNVTVNLYKEGVGADGTATLTLVDTTQTSSFDAWAQGFRTDKNGNFVQASDPGVPGSAGYVPNMSCPGQDPTSGFFATLQNSKMWLDQTVDPVTGMLQYNAPKKPLAYKAQFKCFDGWSMQNQIQPTPYDGKYQFPSTVRLDPVTGRPTGQGALAGAPTPMNGTNCSICIVNPDDGTPMLPAGKYVVELVTPPGYEIVKEEDKNILMGDIYIAPVTQQFAGLGNVFILPDQAAINSYYNANNPLNPTTNLGVVNPREDFASNDQMWPCVGQVRVVPDYMSLFTSVQQTAPFAGASRSLCDRKEVSLNDQATVSAKFYVFTKEHVAGHFVGIMTNDMASEFDPFSPQFGEKFAPPNLPVDMRDFMGTEVARVYADQWGEYNGLYMSTWEVNPPNPTGYAPQMSISCMNDPGPILDRDPDSPTHGQMITDPAYNAAYSNFCYETPLMPGATTYMDTPVVPVQAFADHYNLPDSEYPDGTPVIKRADFQGSTTPGPWAANTTQSLILTAFGDRIVQNPNYTGPSGTGSTYGSKTLTRHYGFGTCSVANGACAAVNGIQPGVTIGGLPAKISSWSDASINVTVPANLPVCAGPRQQGQQAARCGEVVITAGTGTHGEQAGKMSFDGITVTIGGKKPTIVEPNCTANPCTTKFGEFYPNPLQTAIDNAAPGDLLIVDAGVYRENLIMWKPVRLQGVGAGAVTINADAHPAGKMDAWRRRISCLFGLTIQGAPLSQGPASSTPNTQSAYDPAGVYTCPDPMYFRADRLPFEGFVGWDAASNGNLAELLQEPSLMGAYEGAGVTVVGRGVNQSATGNSDLWGMATGGGTYANGSRYVNDGATRRQTNDCATATTNATFADYGTGNFLCNPSSIDGFTIINSSQGGGGIFMHGFNSNVQIANNRIAANAGTLSGAINVGNGEVPPSFTADNTICAAAGAPAVANPAPLCPPMTPNNQLPNVAPVPLNGEIPMQFNTNVHVHHNQIINNASIGDALFSGTPSGAGGVSVSAGGDNYEIDHNWVAGNLTSGNGGGIAHMGVSFNGNIHHNVVMFNEANNATLEVDGGGIVIMGAQEDRTFLNGQECGSTNDLDCPPGMGDGTGPGLRIDSNLILGNGAAFGSGGGLRLQQTNGTEVAAFATHPDPDRRLNWGWYDVAVTNNIIVNNLAGWDGGGVSLQDSLKTSFINNTVASNDTTASAGVLFKTLGAIDAAAPPPGCLPTPDPTQPQDPSCMGTNAPHIPQPAGLVTMQNTPNMISQTPNGLVCPAGFGYGDPNSDSQGSRTNGRCVLVGLPKMVNDLFWQNRAFHVEIVDDQGNPIAGTSTPNGPGLRSQQNIVALLPTLNQTATGQCVSPAGMKNFDGTPLQLYWDVGVRMDEGPQLSRHVLTFNQATVGSGGYPTGQGGSGARANPADTGPVSLTALSSIFSDSVNAGGVLGTNYVPPAGNQLLTNAYCNGARTPPEQCSVGQGANAPEMCHGYFAPAGQSETAGVKGVFVFNNISATATVDEGQNWINMTYGPLTLSRPPGNGSTAPSAEPLVETTAVAKVSGAYTIPAGSAAIGAGTGAGSNGVPTTDFFGQARSSKATTIGAVEYVPPAPTLTAITPSSGPAGSTVAVTLTGTNFLPANDVINVSGSGVTVQNVTADASGTQLSANFVIAGNAATTARNVTVTTGGGTTSAVTFTITAPPKPALTSVSPTSVFRGTTVGITLIGANLSGVSVAAGNGVSCTPDAGGTATSMTATCVISNFATLGGHNLTVSNAGGTSNAVTLTVGAPPSLSGTGFPLNVAPGSTTARTFTYTNSTSAAVTLGTAALSPIQGLTNAFTITTDNCSGKTIAGSGTCTIVVTLKALPRPTPARLYVYGATLSAPATTAGVPTATLILGSSSF
jgi:Big-like domain-containing protein/multicopper oxidase